jgi:hypothetical protein
MHSKSKGFRLASPASRLCIGRFFLSEVSMKDCRLTDKEISKLAKERDIRHDPEDEGVVYCLLELLDLRKEMRRIRKGNLMFSRDRMEQITRYVIKRRREIEARKAAM